MEVVVEKSGACRRTLKIRVPADEVKSEYDRILGQFKKVAKIPGFRPGKAPAQMVQARYAKDINEEVRSQLVPRTYQEALKTESIDVVTVLNVSEPDIKQGEALAFEVTLDAAPEFELSDYTAVEVQPEEVTVTDDQIDETINRIREHRARYEDISDRAIQEGDLAQIDYCGTVDGEMIENLNSQAAGIGQGKDFWVRVDENAFIPEFHSGLLGARIGDQKKITVKFDADFTIPELRGKEGSYVVDVKALKEQVLPELDAAFAAELQAESMEDLRSRIKDDLQREGEQREEQRQKDEIIKQLLAQNNVEVPESQVEQETRQSIQEIVGANSNRGIPEDQIIEQKDEIYAAANKIAMERVKVRYILDRIAAIEKVEVQRDDLDREIARMAMAYQADPATILEQIKKNGSMEELERSVRSRKTTELLLEKAKQGRQVNSN